MHGHNFILWVLGRHSPRRLASPSLSFGSNKMPLSPGYGVVWMWRLNITSVGTGGIDKKTHVRDTSRKYLFCAPQILRLPYNNPGEKTA
jgi:hypothetical protein